jgi:DNA helicase-2/ATP-dependent DNA helicase PcrA
VAGLEEGLFPYTHFPSDHEDEEEERRLFYVALTRAKKKLFLSFSHSRTFFGGKQNNRPSKFLNEIPKGLLET